MKSSEALQVTPSSLLQKAKESVNRAVNKHELQSAAEEIRSMLVKAALIPSDSSKTLDDAVLYLQMHQETRHLLTPEVLNLQRVYHERVLVAETSQPADTKEKQEVQVKAREILLFNKKAEKLLELVKSAGAVGIANDESLAKKLGVTTTRAVLNWFHILQGKKIVEKKGARYYFKS